MANKDAEAVLEATSNIPGIERLSIIGYRNLSSKAMASLWKLDKLSNLAVSRSNLKGADLASIDEMLQLKELYAGDIKDISPLITLLARSPNLETLDVSQCNLNESDYSNLSQISRLKKLIIDGNHTNEKELDLLAGKTHLETLSLARSSFKGDLSKSFGKFRNLKTLILTKGYVPIAQINLLKKEHPKLTVIVE
jgi:Leucine-rich repeat (LRR) protein